MPPVNLALMKEYFLRQFYFGAAKTKKTWGACRLAELGFNVVVFDGDDGAHILKNLSPEAQKRVLVCAVRDTQDRPVFMEFMRGFMKATTTIFWNEQTKVFDPRPKPGFSYIKISPHKLDGNTLLVIDSWTSLVQSVSKAFAVANNIDLFDAAKKEWDGYGYEGRLLSEFLAVIKAINSHVIVIGHETIIEKKDKQGNVISSKTLPVSSSNPHSMRIPDKFSDVLYFNKKGKDWFQIDTSGEVNRPGGSRLIPPGVYKWEELPPQKFIEALGQSLPENPEDVPECEAFVWYEDGQTLLEELQNAAASRGKTVSAPLVQGEDKAPTLNALASTTPVKVNPFAPKKIGNENGK